MVGELSDDDVLIGIAASVEEQYDPYDEGPEYCRRVDWDEVAGIAAEGETFPQKLARFLREKGMKPSEAYGKIGMSRQQFSKIARVRGARRPSKGAVLGLAMAMRLSLDETRELVESANYAMMNSDKRDVAVRYLLEHEYYDIPSILIKFHELGFEPFVP